MVQLWYKQTCRQPQSRKYKGCEARVDGMQLSDRALGPARAREKAHDVEVKDAEKWGEEQLGSARKMQQCGGEGGVLSPLLC